MSDTPATGRCHDIIMGTDQHLLLSPVMKDDFCARLVREITKDIGNEAAEFETVMKKDHYMLLGHIFASYARALGVRPEGDSDVEEDKANLAKDTGGGSGVALGEKSADSNQKKPDADLQLSSDHSDDTIAQLDKFDAAKMLYNFTKKPQSSYEDCDEVAAYLGLLVSKASRNIHPTIIQLQTAKDRLGRSWWNDPCLPDWKLVTGSDFQPL